MSKCPKKNTIFQVYQARFIYICNDEIYGFITIPLEKDSSLEMDISQLTNIKLEITGTDQNFKIF